MKVRDVMTTEVVAVHEDTPFKAIVEILLERGIGSMPVVDADGALTGIVTRTDLLVKPAYAGSKPGGLPAMVAEAFGGDPAIEKAGALRAADVMTTPVVRAHPDEPLRSATRRMLEQRVKQLPVEAGGRVVGMLSRSDVLRMYARTDETLRRRIADLLEQCLFVPPEHDVQVDVADGIVRLRGTVATESDVHVLRAVIAAAEGVVGVEDRLRSRTRDRRRTG